MFTTALCRVIYLAFIVPQSLCVPTPAALESVSLDIVNGLNIRDTPPVPSVEEIKKHLSVAKDTCLFYSGPGGYGKKARDWAKGKKNGYKVLSQLWTDSR